MKKIMDLQKLFKEETGQDITDTGTDGVHRILITVPSKKYVEWLEKKITTNK